jgi:serine/threonine-protein kinase RsbW
MMSSSREKRMPALPASLNIIQDLIQEIWSCDAGVTSADRIRFETAVTEIAGNIIEHSVPGAGVAVVTMTVEVVWNPNLIRATFLDDAREIHAELRDPEMPGPGSEHGRGLALALSLSDSLRYERAGSMNRWTVECRRSAG